MKLVTFGARGRSMVGVWEGDWVIDLTRAGKRHLEQRGLARAAARAQGLVPPEMSALLEGGDETLGLAREIAADLRPSLAAPEGARGLHEAGIVWEIQEVRLMPPVPRPGKILCVGRNYRKPAGTLETGEQYPTFFGRFAHTLLAPGAPFVLPEVSEQVDYEGELVAVIGRHGRSIPESRALDFVAGYAIFDEISVRDYQKRTTQWFIGKNFDHSGPMGPALVTRDEIPDPQALILSVDVSGERLQEASTETMIFPVAALIASASEAMTLEPGDLIVTGTPSGVGATRTPPRWLHAGDVVRVAITGLGILETPIVAPAGAR